MKTTNLLTALLTFLFSKVIALSPVGTFTFVNPCQPFGSISSFPGTYGCFSYSASNAGATDPNSYYSWSFGDGTSATGTNVLHCYSPCTVSTIYTVVLSYNSAALCGPLPTQQSYTLQLNPPSQGLCVRNTPSVSLAATSVTVWSGAVIPETMFSYKFGDNTGTSNQNLHTYAACGSYIIEVKDWDMNQPQYLCYGYVAVNISCSNVITGINEKSPEPSGLNLFPNPASQNITVLSKKAINGIKIVDVLGRECLPETKINSSETMIPLTDLKPGTYFLKVAYTDGSGQMMKFIKE